MHDANIVRTHLSLQKLTLHHRENSRTRSALPTGTAPTDRQLVVHPDVRLQDGTQLQRCEHALYLALEALRAHDVLASNTFTTKYVLLALALERFRELREAHEVF